MILDEGINKPSCFLSYMSSNLLEFLYTISDEVFSATHLINLDEQFVFVLAEHVDAADGVLGLFGRPDFSITLQDGQQAPTIDRVHTEN